MRAYFALRVGWLKINVGTNLGPQIYMYLSVLGIFRTPSEVSSQLYFVEICSQRSYGFLITKELIFGFQILDLKDHFSASLTLFSMDYF